MNCLATTATAKLKLQEKTNGRAVRKERRRERKRERRRGREGKERGGGRRGEK